MRFDWEDQVRDILKRAQREAAKREHIHTCTEHLLWGWIEVAAEESPELLDRLGIDHRTMLERLEEAWAAVPRSNRRARGGQRRRRPYTSSARKALELTMREAKRLGHGIIGIEEFLLGLLRTASSRATEILAESGVTLERAREEFSGTPSTERTGFRVEIDDTSSDSIYEQIVDQIREAVATGELPPETRLLSVRRQADELDIAPGTVARAYSELERLGVVVAEGAKGTRVARPHREAPPSGERHDNLVGLLRPVAVAAFHQGATAAELRGALEPAMRGILTDE